MDTKHILPGEMVYIVILNWNGWRDTIECLESVFKVDYHNYKVVVCDNSSQDFSLEHIKAWAGGRLNVDLKQEDRLRDLSFPPVPKPISYREYNREQAESGGTPEDSASPLILIQTGANLGFAGGNNVGLRYALRRNDFAYIWLLNNDTVICPASLRALVEKMRSNPRYGICGSKLFYYHKPDFVQTQGGARYFPLVATSRHIGAALNKNSISDPGEVEGHLDYIVGASMLASKLFLEQVGLMSEEYFLYFEEIDWAMRGKDRFRLAYASDSVVYHKSGTSTSGCFCAPAERSETADYYGVRNRLVFTRKYYKYFLPIVYLSLFGAIFNRIRKKQWRRAGIVWRIMTFRPR